MKKILKNKILVAILASLLLLCLLITTAVVLINSHVISSSKGRIVTIDEAVEIGDFDCVIVLGCLVRSDGSLSDMLNDRMEVGVDAFCTLNGENDKTKLIVSGDHGSESYNEVEAMKQYAVEQGIDSSEVFMDHAGFSTYESIYRAKEIFGAEKILIVTQEYHLYRALYIADAFGLDAYGVSADLRTYSGQIKYSTREVLARNKDFFASLFKPEPTYLGEKIGLGGDGDITND